MASSLLPDLQKYFRTDSAPKSVRQRPETLMSTWKSLVREDIYLPYRQKAKSRIWESVVRDIYKQQRIEKSR
jgi:hypothetical protein